MPQNGSISLNWVTLAIRQDDIRFYKQVKRLCLGFTLPADWGDISRLLIWLHYFRRNVLNTNQALTWRPVSELRLYLQTPDDVLFYSLNGLLQKQWVPLTVEFLQLQILKLAKQNKTCVLQQNSRLCSWGYIFRKIRSRRLCLGLTFRWVF